MESSVERIEASPVEELSEGLRTLALLFRSGTEAFGTNWYLACGAGRSNREELLGKQRCEHHPCQNFMTWVCFAERHSFCEGNLAGHAVEGCRCICHLPGFGNERRRHG